MVILPKQKKQEKGCQVLSIVQSWYNPSCPNLLIYILLLLENLKQVHNVYRSAMQTVICAPLSILFLLIFAL